MARVEAYRLIAQKPWRNRLDWAAGRVTYEPGREGSLIDLMILVSFLVCISALVWSLMEFGVGVLVAAAVSLVAGSILIHLRVRGNRLRKSECILQSVPARIGGAFGAEVRVRVGATQALAVLTNVAIKYRGSPIEVWCAEQRIGQDDIRPAGDDAWTIPVHIQIPPEVRTRQLGSLWRLSVHVQAEGADFKPRFEVPVFDLADLHYAEDENERKTIAYAKSQGKNLDIVIGVLVGTIIAFGLGFGFADRAAYKSLKGLFMVPFLGAIFMFMALGPWRNAAAVAIRDRDLPGKEWQTRQQLVLLTLAPWIAAAIVLWIALSYIPYAGIVWGLGMLLCAHPSPFGWTVRDPLLQSGTALIFCTLIAMRFS